MGGTRPCAGSTDPEFAGRPRPGGQRAAARTDGQAGEQRAAVRTSRRRLAHSGQAYLHPGGDGPVNPVQERCHNRVAVLRPQLVMRRGRGADVIWGYRRRIHTARLTLQRPDRAGGDVAGHVPGRGVGVVRRLDQVGEAGIPPPAGRRSARSASGCTRSGRPRSRAAAPPQAGRAC